MLPSRKRDQQQPEAPAPAPKPQPVLSENEAREKFKALVGSMSKGTKYVTLRKKRAEHTVTLNAGAVVWTSPGARNMEGWSSDRVLDWADRCRVNVYLSEDSGKVGELVKEPLEMPKL